MTYQRGANLEYGVDYKDEGCNLAPSCLRCPFERCQFDTPEVSTAAVLREGVCARCGATFEYENHGRGRDYCDDCRYARPHRRREVAR